MVEAFETALAWIKCQVIDQGLLEGLHYLKVLTQVHCERVPNGQHNTVKNFHSAEDVDGILRTWDSHFVLQQDLSIG